MNTLLQSRLTTLEQSLTTLLESLSSYNPSPPAAHALLSADSALQSALVDLATHQRNNARIQALQSTLQRRNDEIRETVQALADTRVSLLEIPNSLPSNIEGKNARKEIETETLLRFAAGIARNAPPISSSFEVPKAEPVGGGSGEGEDRGDGAVKEGVGLAALIEDEKKWLDPWTGVQMTPWPSEEMIRMSGLARLQAGEKFGVEAKAETEKGEDEVMTDVGGTMDRNAYGGHARAAVKREEKPKTFVMSDLYDPEQDD